MAEAPQLGFGDKLSLFVQRFVGWIAFPVWGSICFLLMRFLGRYRIEHIQQLRQEYQRLVKAHPGPIILCSNHLTKIDSGLITWSLGSIWTYMHSFRLFSWNLPERERYFGNIFLRLICYFGSCIPVDRGGDRSAVNHSLDKIRYLMNKNHVITLFPEGKRSVRGKVDTKNYSYGVGKLLESVQNCKVICVYLRGSGQEKRSSVPRIGDTFYVKLRPIQIASQYQGIRAARDYSKQIIHALHQMEEEYFALCR